MNTAKEFASMFDGREYGEEVSANEGVMLKDAGLVAVFGSSDDLMGFRGAIDDEIGCADGGTAYLNDRGLLENDCREDDCPYFAEARSRSRTINAVWADGGGPYWSYTTSIPHETFWIMEEGELICAGIVFALKDAKQENQS